MNVITRGDLSGAGITAIHEVEEIIGEINCVTFYFSVDRGFTFTLPSHRDEIWSPVPLPRKAKPVPDEWDNVRYEVKKTFFGRRKLVRKPLEKIDFVKRIKTLRIAGVYCCDVDESGFFEPEDVHILFEDNSITYCISAAPPGIPIGLFYLTEDEYSVPAKRIDYFDIKAQ